MIISWQEADRHDTGAGAESFTSWSAGQNIKALVTHFLHQGHTPRPSQTVLLTGAKRSNKWAWGGGAFSFKQPIGQCLKGRGRSNVNSRLAWASSRGYRITQNETKQENSMLAICCFRHFFFLADQGQGCLRLIRPHLSWTRQFFQPAHWLQSAHEHCWQENVGCF